MIKHAVISDCGKYRYSLTRRWSEGPIATFVMLNPSTADAENDDPTIRRCISFAKKWNCGGIRVLNLFAVRATDPKNMYLATDPVGPDNKEYFDRAFEHSDESGPVICAWGVHGDFMGQDLQVMGWFDSYCKRVQCLGVTKNGQPRHPLYVSGYALPMRYWGRLGKGITE